VFVAEIRNRQIQGPLYSRRQRQNTGIIRLCSRQNFKFNRLVALAGRRQIAARAQHDIVLEVTLVLRGQSPLQRTR
jgi:hypothetical protein